MKSKLFTTAILAACALFTMTARAQTNEFTYQGKLTDSGTLSATYDFEFRLCASGLICAPPLQTIQRLNVPVTNGIFTVTLGFDAAFFNGSSRYLDISVRRTAADPWTQLSPRQQITSAPYSIKSLFSTDALQLGGIAANQFVITNDTRLSDDRNPLPNSPNYINNSTAPQTPSNFNISGNGTANILNAVTQYNLNGQRVLSNRGSENIFVGIGSGANILLGNQNSFFGQSSGFSSDGSFNSFYGYRAGYFNEFGSNNSFFGSFAGSGSSLFSGSGNSFFGTGSGATITSGDSNSFFGAAAGSGNTTGSNNSFFGNNAGFGNNTGSNNSFFGALAVGATGLTNSTAIGFRAFAAQSNSLVLGSVAGANGCTLANSCDSVNVGIGTTLPAARLHISGVGITRARVNSDSNAGLALTLNNQPRWSVAAVSGGQFQIFNDATGLNAVSINSSNNFVGIGTTAPDQLLTVNGNASKSIGGGSWATFSDERLKNINGRYTRGLADLLLLNPIVFQYKQGNALGLRSAGETVGFSAQEVQKIIPEAVNTSESGYLQINNDPILWTMLNAVKEQNAQILKQRQQIDELKQIVCELKPEAEICKLR
jgi:Chaperone of endosialidase